MVYVVQFHDFFFLQKRVKGKQQSNKNAWESEVDNDK